MAIAIDITQILVIIMVKWGKIKLSEYVKADP